MSCLSPLNATDKIKRFLAEFYVDGDEGKLFKYGEQLVSETFVNNSCLIFEGFLSGANIILCNRVTENILSLTSTKRNVVIDGFVAMLCCAIVASFLLKRRLICFFR